MNNIKWQSRKFWMAVSQIVGGLLMIFNFSESEIAVVSGAILSVSSAIVYIITEGKIDATRLANAVKDTQDAVEVIKK